MTQQSHEQAMITLMEEILRILGQHEANEMIHFYVNGRHFSTDDQPTFIEHQISTAKKTFSYYEDPVPCNVTKQVEFNNPQTITMTFEGPMYHDINYGSGKILDKINKRATKYGLYAELGYAWSLALYKI